MSGNCSGVLLKISSGFIRINVETQAQTLVTGLAAPDLQLHHHPFTVQYESLVMNMYYEHRMTRFVKPSICCVPLYYIISQLNSSCEYSKESLDIPSLPVWMQLEG